MLSESAGPTTYQPVGHNMLEKVNHGGGTVDKEGDEFLWMGGGFAQPPEQLSRLLGHVLHEHCPVLLQLGLGCLGGQVAAQCT